MGGLFSSPKSVQAPPPQPPPPLPDVSEDVEDIARRKRSRGARGRRATFLVGELAPETKKKKVLG